MVSLLEQEGRQEHEDPMIEMGREITVAFS